MTFVRAAAVFLQELISCEGQQSHKSDEARHSSGRVHTGKRKRGRDSGAEKEAAASIEHGQEETTRYEEGRTVERYYDRPIDDRDFDEEGEETQRKKHAPDQEDAPSSGWVTLLPSAAERDPDGFEVQSFELICPLKRLKLFRKQKEGITEEINKKSMWLRILRFETEDIAVLLVRDFSWPVKLKTD